MSSVWKKISLSFLAISVLTAVRSQQGVSLTANDQAEIMLTKKYTEVELWGNVTVILTNSVPGNLVVEGTRKDVNKVRAQVNRGRLDINADDCSSRVVIYMSATNVKSLIINGDAEILSSGPIRVRDLSIVLNGSSKLQVEYFGNVKVVPGKDYDFTLPVLHGRSAREL